MQKYTGWKIPLYVDTLNDKNNFENRFKTWPFRVFAIDRNGKLIWMMEPAPNDGLFDFKEIDQQIKMAISQKNDGCIIL